jgi:hypothetical protein
MKNNTFIKKINFFIAALCVNMVTQAQTPTLSITPDTIKPVATFDTLAARTDRTSVDPPIPVKTRFLTEYPATTAVFWKVKSKYYIVTYTDPKTKLGHIIAYDKNGKTMQQEDEVNNLNYPPAIYAYYAKKFPGEKYFKVWQTKSKAGQIYYYIFGEGKALWFDKDGNYVPANNIRSADVTSYSFDLK